MLAFSSVCDAHFHLFQCIKSQNQAELFKNLPEYYGCTAIHDVAEYDETLNLEKTLFMQMSDSAMAEMLPLFADRASSFDSAPNVKKVHIIRSFGLHPQMPLIKNAAFLEELLCKNQIAAIGEAGFDFFTEEFKKNVATQKEAWNIQLELAQKYCKPLVIHCRKGIDLIFADIKRLKTLPAVLFHSFYGGIREAESLCQKLPNAYFSFGKQILKGNKKTLSCVASLPLDRLLLETDAPFQTLKGEPFTAVSEITRVYKAFFDLRGLSSEQGAIQLKKNFFAMYGLCSSTF